MRVPAQCACGETFEREIPDELSERWRSKLLEMPAQCERCVEVAQEEERLEREAAHIRQEVERTHRRRQASGIPAKLRNLRWEDLVRDGRSNAIDAAFTWPTGESSGLLLVGSVGIGKTRIAATAAWQYLQTAPLAWLSAPLLFARLGSGFGSEQRDQALEVLTGTTALVLDDLDKVRPTEYAAEHVFLAIDGRVTEGVPLIVTMNLTLDALAAKFPEPFGPAIASRLAEYCETYLLEGADRRLEAAA